jgi:aminoglycoside phosphotransferase (APT) family kinase protein
MCSDASVIGTPFYVMEFAAGTIFTNPNLPDVGPRWVAFGTPMVVVG